MFDSSPWSTSWFHSFANFAVPGSAVLMVTFVPPLVLNGWPPASHIMLVTKPGSPMSAVMYSFEFAACSFLASATYSSQVVGTVRPYFWNTFSL